MRRTLPRITLVALASCAGVALLTAADTPKPVTEWVARPAEAARVARVEAGLAPVSLPGEEPLKLSLQRWMELYKIPGLSVAVFEKNTLVWAKTYGVKQAGGSEPVTLDTLFQAASISKPVTAMAALRYAEQGKWSLDANINDKLLSWKVPDNDFTKEQKVTLRRLLSHSAGLTVHGFPGYSVDAPRPTLQQILDGEKPANTAPVRVDIVPGTKTRYSGGGTTVVQQMMVDQLKKPFPQIMRETVLAPLGLKHSTYEQPPPPAFAARTAAGTYASGQSVEGRWHVYPEMAAAGLWTTPSDLSRIAIEVSKARAGTSKRVVSQ
ncbi:MAG TPA: serine hydrolase domain-containing protein, partial [Archangium sp.]